MCVFIPGQRLFRPFSAIASVSTYMHQCVKYVVYDYVNMKIVDSKTHSDSLESDRNLYIYYRLIHGKSRLLM